MKPRDPFDEVLKEAIRTFPNAPRSHTKCPTEGELAGYLDARLLPEQERELEGHLVACERCRKTLAAAAGVGRPPTGADDPAEPKPPPGGGPEEDEAAEPTEFEEELSRLEEELGIRKKGPDLSGMPSIMVVDDDVIYLDSLTDVLSQDYTVVACSSGREAAEKIHHRIRAVVLDIKMPGMDGLEVARRLKDSHPDIPLIFNTGYPGEYVQERIQREYDPCRYVTKDNPDLLEGYLSEATEREPSSQMY